MRVGYLGPAGTFSEQAMHQSLELAGLDGEAEIVAAQCLSGRIQPVDVAALALFLASDDAHMCTGHDYFVDAGWR